MPPAMTLPRTLEPEAMDSAEETDAYDAMDHGAVNRAFVDDLLAVAPTPGRVLDLGAGTALIPVEIARRAASARVTAVDLASTMLRRGAEHVARAGLTARVGLVVASATALPYGRGDFDVVVSNSLAHHIPEPAALFASIAAVAGDGAVFVRDLVRPETDAAVDALVSQHAADEAPAARELFRASLRAALTIGEVRALADANGLADAVVAMSSDRHWTLSRRRAG
jgi:ubiquinone/menaquinone biosynthesis C-methylase UbiE